MYVCIAIENVSAFSILLIYCSVVCIRIEREACLGFVMGSVIQATGTAEFKNCLAKEGNQF